MHCIAIYNARGYIMQKIVDITGHLNKMKGQELGLNRKLTQMERISIAVKELADQTSVLARKVMIVAAHVAEADNMLLAMKSKESGEIKKE